MLWCAVVDRVRIRRRSLGQRALIPVKLVSCLGRPHSDPSTPHLCHLRTIGKTWQQRSARPLPCRNWCLFIHLFICYGLCFLDAAGVQSWVDDQGGRDSEELEEEVFTLCSVLSRNVVVFTWRRSEYRHRCTVAASSGSSCCTLTASTTMKRLAPTPNPRDRLSWALARYPQSKSETKLPRYCQQHHH